MDDLTTWSSSTARQDGEAECQLHRFAEVDYVSPSAGEAEHRLDRFADADFGPPQDRNGERRLDRSEFERERAAGEDGEAERRLERFAVEVDFGPMSRTELKLIKN